MPEGLVESELFGHVKGSFSGAIRDKKGRFELADGGTIFLDEIAELSKHMQAKLLHFLQDGKFEKVGGEKTVRINVRVISATNSQPSVNRIIKSFSGSFRATAINVFVSAVIFMGTIVHIYSVFVKPNEKLTSGGLQAKAFQKTEKALR